MVNADELARLNVERHGAIRVGTAQELATLRRMFAIMGMYRVSCTESLAGRGAGTLTASAH
ncbi:2-oxoadipate dioxygenase/decarboxylase family protein [Escherichia coli]